MAWNGCEMQYPTFNQEVGDARPGWDHCHQEVVGTASHEICAPLGLRVCENHIAALSQQEGWQVERK